MSTYTVPGLLLTSLNVTRMVSHSLEYQNVTRETRRLGGRGRRSLRTNEFLPYCRAPLRPLQTLSLSGKGELVWVTFSALKQAQAQRDRAQTSALGHSLLRFAPVGRRLAVHVSLLKCLRSPAGKAAVELGGTQGFRNPSDAQTLLEYLSVSLRGDMPCEHQFGWSSASRWTLDQTPSHVDPSRLGRDDRAGILAELPLPSPLLFMCWPWSPLLESLH